MASLSKDTSVIKFSWKSPPLSIAAAKIKAKLGKMLYKCWRILQKLLDSHVEADDLRNLMSYSLTRYICRKILGRQIWQPPRAAEVLATPLQETKVSCTPRTYSDNRIFAFSSCRDNEKSWPEVPLFFIESTKLNFAASGVVNDDDDNDWWRPDVRWWSGNLGGLAIGNATSRGVGTRR